MANVHALTALVDGLATHLSRSYPAALRQRTPATFEPLVSGTLHNPPAGGTETSRITLWPYKVSVNEHFRNREFPLSPGLTNRPLSLDVHLLVSVWAGTVDDELTLFAWTLRELHQLPVLDASVLSTIDAGLRPDEQIQLVPADLSLEDLMRLWDGVKPGYRLSAPFVARVVQLDITQAEAPPVVARRVRLTDAVEGPSP